ERAGARADEHVAVVAEGDIGGEGRTAVLDAARPLPVHAAELLAARDAAVRVRRQEEADEADPPAVPGAVRLTGAAAGHVDVRARAGRLRRVVRQSLATAGPARAQARAAALGHEGPRLRPRLPGPLEGGAARCAGDGIRGRRPLRAGGGGCRGAG